MKTSVAINTIINIAATICIIFAVPIVFPVNAVLGTLLIIFSALFTLGIIAQIFMSYST